MTVTAEIDAIIGILEAQLPANPNSPQNVRLRKGLERKLASYFDDLQRAFPYSKLAGIYNKHVITESLGSETRNILDPLLTTFDDRLTTTIGGQLAEVYISGQAEMITWGQTKAGIPIAYEGPPIQQAIDWAEQHGASLVKGMDEETKRRLAHTISQGIENKRGIPGLSRDIRNTFDHMSKYRSELVARTETANALSQASLDSMEDMGIDGKEWITVGDSQVSIECQGNEAEGVIPTKQLFSGGVSAPPQHPNCRCALAPATLPVKAKPPAKEPPAEDVSPEMQNLIDNKLKVTGRAQYDKDGLLPTLNEVKAAKLPDSHLASIRSIELNTAKIGKRGGGAMASCDKGNNIVLAGHVGRENIVHEIGHSFWNKRVFVPDNISKIKYNILDAFGASTKTGKGFPSLYARTDVEEFFAECYAAYARNAAAFTKLNPTMGKILKSYWK